MVLSVHFVSSRDGRLWHKYTAQQNAVEKIQVFIFPCSTSSGAVKKKILQHKTYNSWEDCVSSHMLNYLTPVFGFLNYTF